jgi:hypothetical protein
LSDEECSAAASYFASILDDPLNGHLSAEVAVRSGFLK